MTAKEELREIFFKGKEIDNLQDQIAETEARLQKCTSILSDMPTARGGSADRITDGIADLIEFKERLNKKLAEEVNYTLACRDRIDRITDGRFRVILKERYFGKKSFEEISMIINYNYYNTIKLHGMALRAYSETHQDLPTI